jgi:hypothetical protein
MKFVARDTTAVNHDLEIVSRDEARRRLGNISPSTEDRQRKTDPDFPKLVDYAPGLRGYINSELSRYIALLMERRDSGYVSPLVERGRALGESRKGKPSRSPGRPRKRPAL